MDAVAQLGGSERKQLLFCTLLQKFSCLAFFLFEYVLLVHGYLYHIVKTSHIATGKV